MPDRFRKKKSTTNQNFDKLIQELKEENERQNKALKEIFDNLYDKNKKDNEIKGAFDIMLKIAIIVIIAFTAAVFVGMIVYVWQNKTDTIQNKVVVTIDLVLITVILALMIIQLWKENNRNYIMSCITLLIAMIALFVALLK